MIPFLMLVGFFGAVLLGIGLGLKVAQFGRRVDRFMEMSDCEPRIPPDLDQEYARVFGAPQQLRPARSGQIPNRKEEAPS